LKGLPSKLLQSLVDHHGATIQEDPSVAIARSLGMRKINVMNWWVIHQIGVAGETAATIRAEGEVA